MYAEVRKKCVYCCMIPQTKTEFLQPLLTLAEENVHTRHNAMKYFQEEAESVIAH